VDKVIQHIEDPKSVGIENFRVKKEFEGNMPELCRFGHSLAEVKNTTFLIYGGVDQNDNVLSYPVLYDVIEQMTVRLEETGIVYFLTKM
jgi:hypothetical protein